MDDACAVSRCSVEMDIVPIVKRLKIFFKPIPVANTICPSRLALLGLFCAMPVLPGAGQAREAPYNHVEENKSIILKVWQRRVLDNGGVHAWNSKNDAKRVFQEWITLLTLNASADSDTRRSLGQRLEAYVMNNNMSALGKVGTSLPLPGYRHRDFDMTLLGCISLLGLFQYDSLLLTNRTFSHLIQHVSRLWGQEPKHYFDILMLHFQETENHVLMIESTRYLTNQFIWSNARNLPAIAALRDSLTARGIVLENTGGPVYALLLKQMNQIVKAGFFEFNARVYQRFSLHALDNLYSFAEDSLIATAAAAALDYTAAKFAFQSAQSVRLGPYRRNAKKFRAASLLKHDQALSFFAAQSNCFPPGYKLKTALWETSTPHSSAALFSAVLKYRVPSVILDYMQKTRCSYIAMMETRHKFNGRLESSPEYYFKTPKFMVTAGGRYRFYRGPNFPVRYTNFFMDDAPWVYDVTSRSSSVFLYSLPDSFGVQGSLLAFRGLQWKENNLAVYRNFMYGYAAAKNHNSRAWPHQIPKQWRNFRQVVFEQGKFEYKLIDMDRFGNYLVLTRLKPGKTFWRYDYQKYTRGTAEVIDTRAVENFSILEAGIRRSAAAAGNKSVYTMWSGERLGLNSRYGPKKRGIKWIEAISETGDAHHAIEPPEKRKFPLLEVTLADCGASVSNRRLAFADGKGNLTVRNPFTGEVLTIHFESWWYPRRKIEKTAPIAPCTGLLMPP